MNNDGFKSSDAKIYQPIVVSRISNIFQFTYPKFKSNIQSQYNNKNWLPAFNVVGCIAHKEFDKNKEIYGL